MSKPARWVPVFACLVFTLVGCIAPSDDERVDRVGSVESASTVPAHAGRRSSSWSYDATDVLGRWTNTATGQEQDQDPEIRTVAEDTPMHPGFVMAIRRSLGFGFRLHYENRAYPAYVRVDSMTLVHCFIQGSPDIVVTGETVRLHAGESFDSPLISCPNSAELHVYPFIEGDLDLWSPAF